MKKLTALFTTLALVVSMCVGCGSSTSSTTTTTTTTTDSTTTTTETASTEPIIIGSIQDVSSTTSVMGYMVNEGVRWAVECINTNGGIDGRMIELIEYDSKADTTESINAYNRLVSEGAVAVVGPHQANIGIALAPIAEEAGVPIFLMGMDNRVTRQGDDGDGDPWTYMFLSQPNCDTQGAIEAKFLIEELGCTNFGIIYRQDNSFSVSIKNGFEAYCAENGGNVVKSVAFNNGDTDFKTILSQLIAEDIDCIVAPNYTQELLNITIQARDLGWEGPLMNGIDSAPPFNTMVTEAGGDPDGVYFLNNIDLEDEAVIQLMADYREATGNDEPDQINKFCLGYDMMMGLASVMLDGAEVSTEGITEAMNTLVYEGITGTITINPETHQPSGLGMIVVAIEDGENVPLQFYAA